MHRTKKILNLKTSYELLKEDAAGFLYFCGTVSQSLEHKPLTKNNYENIAQENEGS